MHYTTRGRDMLLQDAVLAYALYSAGRKATTTQETDGILLMQFRRYAGDETDIRDIDASTVRAYLAHHRQRGLANSTLRRHKAVLSAMWAWLSSDEVGIADKNICNAVANPKVGSTKPKAYTRDEVAAMVAATQQSRLPRRDKAVLLFLADTAARATECVSVAVSDVGWKTGKVLLRNTKGSKERYAYMGDKCKLACMLYVSESRGKPADPRCDALFLTQQKHAMTRHTLRSLVVRTGARAGVEGATTHRFRHFAATSYLRSGAVSLAHLQHLLGHASLQQTREYTLSLTDEDVQECVQSVAPSDVL